MHDAALLSQDHSAKYMIFDICLQAINEQVEKLPDEYYSLDEDRFYQVRSVISSFCGLLQSPPKLCGDMRFQQMCRVTRSC